MLSASAYMCTLLSYIFQKKKSFQKTFPENFLKKNNQASMHPPPFHCFAIVATVFPYLSEKKCFFIYYLYLLQKIYNKVSTINIVDHISAFQMCKAATVKNYCKLHIACFQIFYSKIHKSIKLWILQNIIDFLFAIINYKLY